MIKFLVDTYGREKFALLLKTFKDGSTPDKAFQSIYGFDQLGYENAWRESVGLTARAASASPTAEATQEIRGAATPAVKPTVTASTSNSDGGTPVVTIAIIVALAALLLAAVVAAGMVVMRRL